METPSTVVVGGAKNPQAQHSMLAKTPMGNVKSTRGGKELCQKRGGRGGVLTNTSYAYCTVYIKLLMLYYSLSYFI
jgi:hypothetical protein